MKKYMFFLRLFLFLAIRLDFSSGLVKEFCVRRLNKDPMDYHARFLLAGSYRSEGNNKAAIREYQTLLKYGHKHPRILYGLAMATFKEEIFDESQSYFRMLLEMAWNKKVALDYLGRINLMRGNYSEAISYFELSLQLDPSSPLIIENIGYCYYKTGDLEKSYKAYQKAFELEPRPELEEKMSSVRVALEMNREKKK